MVKKNAIKRYKILDSLLSNHNRYYSVPDLLNKVNEELLIEDGVTVSRRCIEKDLAALELEPYAAPIIRGTFEGKRYVKYADPDFSIFTKKLSEDEENLLSEVLNTLGQFEGINNFEWIDGLKRRLNIKEHRPIIKFDSNQFLRNSNLLGSLFTAISNNQVLRVEYCAFNQSTPVKHTVHPYLLKEYKSRWYLIGRIRNGDIYNFPIDRIINTPIPLPNIEYIEPEEDFEERFEDIVGVTLFENEPVQEMLLWVSSNTYPYIDTKPLHGSQTVIRGARAEQLRAKYPHLKEGRFIKLNCALNYEIRQMVMERMDQMVVLSPTELVKDIATRVERLHNYYQQNINL